MRARMLGYAPVFGLVLATAVAATVSVLTATTALTATTVPAAQVWHDPELPPTTASTDPNQASAASAAQSLLDLETSAHSWKTAFSPLSPAMAAPMSEPASPDVIDLYRLWTTSGSIGGVQQWISAHPPIASKPAGDGSSFLRGALVSTDVTYGYPAVAGKYESRHLLVALAPLSHHRVGIRVDAQVIWYPSRPATEEIPSDTTMVTVTVYTQDNASGSPRTVLRTGTISLPPMVKLLARTVDSSPLAVPGPRSCPADLGTNPRLDLVFSGPPGDPNVVVHDDTNGCGGISFSIAGRVQAPLTDDGLFHRVDQLLGLDLPRVDDG